MITRTSHCRQSIALLLLSFLAIPLLGSGRLPAAERLVVHEWGTFTALQDDDGTALAGINVDAEPLPAFVHNLSPEVLARANSLQNVYMKGTPQRHPYVTLRLETPVIYIYPPDGQRGPMSLDVHVDFRGGWLTQFYPQADAIAPGLKEGKFHFDSIDSSTRSSLDWHGVQVGTQASLPETDSPVWITPRQVRAARLTAESGESEQYLFYRGVGNSPAPLRVVSDIAAGTVQVAPSSADQANCEQSAKIGQLWLVEVRSNGRSAYRTLKPADKNVPRGFAEDDFSLHSIDRLSDSMRGALIAAGLYDDEALAMLATWRNAYFCSPGLRLFFVVPRSWTDRVLPLRVSQPCDMQRVMVARIELVSPEQRKLLALLSQSKNQDYKWLAEAYKSPNFGRLLAGRSDFGDLGVKIPPDFQAYLDLGRFRDALVIDESKKRPTQALTSFINAYGIWAYRWPADSTTDDE